MDMIRHYRVSIEPVCFAIQLSEALRDNVRNALIFHPHRTRAHLVHNVFKLDEPGAVEILNVLKPFLQIWAIALARLMVNPLELVNKPILPFWLCIDAPQLLVSSLQAYK